MRCNQCKPIFTREISEHSQREGPAVLKLVSGFIKRGAPALILVPYLGEFLNLCLKVEVTLKMLVLVTGHLSQEELNRSQFHLDVGKIHFSGH